MSQAQGEKAAIHEAELKDSAVQKKIIDAYFMKCKGTAAAIWSVVRVNSF